MADGAAPLRKAVGFSDESSGFSMNSNLNLGMAFSDYGSYGLKQFSGWVREEILADLVGREGARVFREMHDNSAIIGALLFAIRQAMRKCEWRIEPANDSAAAKEAAEFVDSCRGDMSHTWDDFVVEVLSMLTFGYSVHEIVYKRRLGPTLHVNKFMRGDEYDYTPSSKYNDGKIGWRRLPIRGQETVIKWFFDKNGQVRGLTQQPWIGTLIDLPIEKCLLFRPTTHKNNPEGLSILRNAYRSYYFVKRLEELEAILFERMGGFPVLYLPSELIDKANANTPDPQAVLALAAYKKMITNIRVDEQMGAVLPSNVYMDSEGKPSAVRMFELQLVTPEHGRQTVDTDKVIERHSLNMLMTTLADFIHMGHEVRGTNNLANNKVDMFYSATEGWMHTVSGVMNRYAIARLGDLNAIDRDLLPELAPDMPQRLDLDGLGGFIANLAKGGLMLFPDEQLEQYIRDAAGFPDVESSDDPEHQDGNADSVRAARQQAMLDAISPPPPTDGNGKPQPKKNPKSSNDIKKMLLGAFAKEVLKNRLKITK